MKVLVLGGTGTVGSAVARELAARGVEIDVLTRDPDKATNVPEGTGVVQGDLLEPETIRSAFRGYDGLFLVNGLSTSEATEGLMALAGARLGGIRRIVYLSVYQVDQGAHLPHFGGKLAVESAILASGIPATVLRPNSFFQNDLRLKQAILDYGVYPLPLGPVGVSRVDVRDIAELAALCFVESGHEGQVYGVVGPELCNGPDTAATWSRLLGREIRYAGEDMEAWEAQTRQFLPGWMAFELRMMYEFFHGGAFRATRAEVERLTLALGRPPRDFETFARETARAWSE